MKRSSALSASLGTRIRSFASGFSAACRRSRPARSPATVTEGPKNSLTTGRTSTEAPVASRREGASSSRNGAMESPVRILIRRPSNLGTSGRPSRKAARNPDTAPTPFSVRSQES